MSQASACRSRRLTTTNVPSGLAFPPVTTPAFGRTSRREAPVAGDTSQTSGSSSGDETAPASLPARVQPSVLAWSFSSHARRSGQEST
jgi:hypothetical protein